MLLHQGLRRAQNCRAIASSRILFCYRPLKLRSDPRTVAWSLRFNTTLPYKPKKPVFPAALLIYHAGTGKTAYLGAMKLTTGFVFLYFCLVAWPYLWEPNQNLLMVGGLCLAGTIPGAWVIYTSRPFVSYIHLKLPLVARQSREALVRYSKSLPSNAAMEITTLKFYGSPKVSTLLVAELHPVKQLLGIANFGRDATARNAQRPWWAGKAIDRFFIRHDSGKTRESGIWETIEKGINKRPLLGNSK